MIYDLLLFFILQIHIYRDIYFETEREETTQKAYFRGPHTLDTVLNGWYNFNRELIVCKRSDFALFKNILFKYVFVDQKRGIVCCFDLPASLKFMIRMGLICPTFETKHNIPYVVWLKHMVLLCAVDMRLPKCVYHKSASGKGSFLLNVSNVELFYA